MSLFKKKEGRPVPSVDDILSALSRVQDPELGRDLVSLNMIRNVAVSGGEVSLESHIHRNGAALGSRVDTHDTPHNRIGAQINDGALTIT